MKNYDKPLTAEEMIQLEDEEIDFSDIPELDEAFWQDAELKLPQGKERVTLRLDREVLDFFRQGGRGYQTRINAVLRAYVNVQKSRTG